MRNMLLWSTMIALLVLMLYDVKYNTRTSQKHTHALEQELIEERKRLHMVQLEWTRLSRPERIRHLSKKHLSLQTINTTQLMDPQQAVWLAAHKQEQAE